MMNALAVSGSTVYVGGWFRSIGGEPRNGLAAIDLDGTVRDWNPDPNGDVRAFAVKGSTLYVGGPFTRIDSQPAGGFAALAQ